MFRELNIFGCSFSIGSITEVLRIEEVLFVIMRSTEFLVAALYFASVTISTCQLASYIKSF
jgi:hypothetical protein